MARPGKLRRQQENPTNRLGGHRGKRVPFNLREFLNQTQYYTNKFGHVLRRPTDTATIL